MSPPCVERTSIHFLVEGDFGRIYKGELIDTSNKCIIKTLQAENASPLNREEYAREIESKNDD